MITIQINTRTFKAPTSWAECSRSQAEALAGFIGYKLSTGISDEVSGVSDEVSGVSNEAILYRNGQEALICAWLRCEPKFWAKVSLQPHEYIFMLKNCEWVFAAPMELSFDYIEHHGRKYYLPEANFKTATALEIAWANMDWMGFQQLVANKSDNTDIENALNELLSIIIRPIRKDFDGCQTDSTWNGDKRQPLAYHICAAIKKEIADLPIATKKLVLAYFEAMNLSFMSEFDVLFGGSDLSSRHQEGAVAPKYPEGFGWEASLRRIAKEGVFGNYEQVCQTNGRQIWMYEYQKYLDLEAEIANMKMQESKK